MKTCVGCKQNKPLFEFNKKASSKDGHRNLCRECQRIARRLYYEKNKDKENKRIRKKSCYDPLKHREYSRRYRAANPMSEEAREKKRERDRKRYWKNRTEQLQRNKAYRDNNHIKVSIRNKTYRDSHRPYFAKYSREWIKSNPHKSREYSNRRRARIKNNGGNFTADEWTYLCEKYNYVCLCCGISHEDSPITADHVIPISRGGSNTIDNIQLLCKSCNSSKGTKDTDYR